MDTDVVRRYWGHDDPDEDKRMGMRETPVLALNHPCPSPRVRDFVGYRVVTAPAGALSFEVAKTMECGALSPLWPRAERALE